MAGLYIHIPFCRKACHYCDFHFSTSLDLKNELVQSLLQELELQKDYLKGQALNSIYFGGGTPSVLTAAELQKILEYVYKIHDVSNTAEITLEANPDDLSLPYLVALKSTGINRLSIGIQSFRETDLTYMNRSHNANQAIQAISDSKEAGFDAISIDLIYGLPATKVDDWAKNIEQFKSYKLDHLSAYCLTIEPGTVLAHRAKNNIGIQPSDQAAEEQFFYLCDSMENMGYVHYEISNFCLPGKQAIHNSQYWNQIPYLGIGPSAHSFNGLSRQWNISNNAAYLKKIKSKEIPFEIEVLGKKEKYQEYLMTGLRRQQGIDLDLIAAQFGKEKIDSIKNGLKNWENKGIFEKNANSIVLTKKGMLWSDAVISDLF